MPWQGGYRLGRPAWVEISEELVIGAYPRLDDIPWLASELRIEAVVNLQDSFDLQARSLQLDTLAQRYEECGIELHHLAMVDDDEGVACRLDEAVTLLGQFNARERRIYMHCNAATNRSPTVAIAYLHELGGLGLEAAIEWVCGKRPCVPYLGVLRARYRNA